MTDAEPEVVERPLQPGDRVQVRYELDDLVHVGERTPPGRIEDVFEGERTPSLVVVLDTGERVPYLANQVLLVDRPAAPDEPTGAS